MQMSGIRDDCYDEPCKYNEYNRHLWTRLLPGYYKCELLYFAWADQRVQLFYINTILFEVGCYRTVVRWL